MSNIIKSSRALKLPTLAAFRRLSFKRKAQVFRDWAARQEGSYDDVSHKDCALARFGKAMGGANVKAIDLYFDCTKGRVEVFNRKFQSDGSSSPIWATAGFVSTFVELTTRLDTYIKKHYPTTSR